MVIGVEDVVDCIKVICDYNYGKEIMAIVESFNFDDFIYESLKWK